MSLSSKKTTFDNSIRHVYKQTLNKIPAFFWMSKQKNNPMRLESAFKKN